ncbi:MAG: FKBP-type peptidyl-prolyl cis-trans isomerase [Saprospiraceae bacterium]|nr:FKBP-type peptidyl-prolyl cis-trans isomerase [Saprospiraceae bacterium]
MKKLTVLFFLGILVMTTMNSCKSAKQKTMNGFDMMFLNDQSGDLVKEGDYVYFRYHVRSKDSLIFSSTMQTPVIKFKLPKLEKVEQKNAQPITEALHLMSKGDSIVVYQTLDDQMKKSIGIPNVEILEFHVFLEDVKNEADYQSDIAEDQKQQAEQGKILMEQASGIAENAKQILSDYKAKKLDANIIKTASGLKYIVHDAGTGAKAEVGSPVSVNYYGMLMDGTRFDDSWSRGQAFTFPLGKGQVIKGWDEGVANLNEGAKATLFIPAELGYGAEGSPPAIPGNSELMFYIEVNKVK